MSPHTGKITLEYPRGNCTKAPLGNPINFYARNCHRVRFLVHSETGGKNTDIRRSVMFPAANGPNPGRVEKRNSESSGFTGQVGIFLETE